MQEGAVGPRCLAHAGGQVGAAALAEELAAEEAVGDEQAEAGAEEERVDDPHGSVTSAGRGLGRVHALLPAAAFEGGHGEDHDQGHQQDGEQSETGVEPAHDPLAQPYVDGRDRRDLPVPGRGQAQHVAAGRQGAE